jgi:hypothetical protein
MNLDPCPFGNGVARPSYHLGDAWRLMLSGVSAADWQ